ncbi:menaquinone-dependent protoporphyrinogen IX dehydrogenase [Capnocytophaga canis]|uniref:menaquinone-dependent protoporphyrinogen IX dehydrogenase n=1 Tax=Capnocytophaga canis TaxID=1848903 RepID=UPI001562907F|nr:menaquinone-dependent protoporphyrinogen IX dehydrogenase [Capnocytophaga canis]
MEKIGIIYATVDGHTKKICDSIHEVLSSKQKEVQLIPVQTFDGNLHFFDKILIASSIRYGNHHTDILKLINENYAVLNIKKAAFISVNLVARKPEKSTETTNPYVVKFLKNIEWKPSVVKVFAGKLNYKIYGFFDRIIIKLIMFITKGPTSSPTEIDYTNWDEVKRFANDFAEL